MSTYFDLFKSTFCLDPVLQQNLGLILDTGDYFLQVKVHICNRVTNSTDEWSVSDLCDTGQDIYRIVYGFT